MQFIKTIPINFHKEASGNESVRIWQHQHSVDDRKIIGRDVRIVQIDWPIGLPLVKNLEYGIWEIRSR